MSIPVVAVVVNVGAIPSVHLTLAGKVTVLLPTLSCVNFKRTIPAFVGGVKVNTSSNAPN